VIAGRVSGKQFIRHVRPAHWLRQVQGWALRCDLLNALRAAGVSEIIHIENGRRFLTMLSEWGDGKVIRDPRFGEQRALPKTDMTLLPKAEAGDE